MNMLLVTFVAFLGLVANMIFAAPTFDTKQIHEWTTATTAVDIFNGSIPTVLYPGQNRSAIFTADGPLVQPIMKQRGEDSQDEKDTLELILFMGTVRQHVGYTVSRDLSESVRNVLRYLCTQGVNPFPGHMCTRGWLEIKNIAYNRGEEAYIAVGVLSDYIPEPAPGSDKHDLINLFIDQLADAFGAAIGCNKNRYQLGSGTECREFANSAEFYQVGIHGRPDFPHLKMKVEFNGKTEEGQFDCLGSQTNVWGTINDDKLKKYSAVLGQGVRASVRCGTDDGEVTGYPTGTCKYGPAKKPLDLTCDLKTDCARH